MFTIYSNCCLLFLGAVCIVMPGGGALTGTEFKQRLQIKVLRPFSACVRDYNSALTSLSEVLDTYAIEEDDMLPPPEISPQLTTAVSGFVRNVKTASSNSHALAEETSNSVAHQTSLISQIQSKIRIKESEIKQNQEKVKGQEEEVKVAQQALNTANNNLNTHRTNLQRAQNRYYRAKNRCLGRRRRRRGIFGSIGNAMKNAFRKPVDIVKTVARKTIEVPKIVVKEVHKGICKMLNVFTRNIQKAKNDVRNAHRQVNHASDRLSQKQNELSSTKDHLAALRRLQASLKEQLHKFRSQLVSLKQKRDKIQAIDQKMKRTVIFIDSIRSSGISAQSVVDLGYLIDAQNLFQPLVEIGNALKGLSGEAASSFIPTLAADQIKLMASKIKMIQEF